jgi:biotin carboxylase
MRPCQRADPHRRGRAAFAACRALDEYYITGIKTTVPFHAAMMRDGDFRDGNYDTGLIDRLVSAGKLNLQSRPLRLHE